MTQGMDVENNRNGNHNGGVEFPSLPPIFHRRSKAGDIPRQFITPGNTLLEAITSSRLTDKNHLNRIILLNHKVEKWDVHQGRSDLLNHVNGLKGIEGRGVDGMLQASAQILVPDWGGPTSKKVRKDIDQVKKHRERGDNGKEYKDDDSD